MIQNHGGTELQLQTKQHLKREQQKNPHQIYIINNNNGIYKAPQKKTFISCLISLPTREYRAGVSGMIIYKEAEWKQMHKPVDPPLRLSGMKFRRKERQRFSRMLVCQRSRTCKFRQSMKLAFLPWWLFSQQQESFLHNLGHKLLENLRQ